MRLLNYLTEGGVPRDPVAVRDFLMQHCGPFLKEWVKMRKPRPVLWRGLVDVKSPFPSIRTVRNDRQPVDTRSNIHLLLDDAFQKKFGIRPRTECVFTYGNDRTSTFRYGDPHIVFPCGGFKFLWSSTIRDLYVYLGEKMIYKNPEKVKDALDEILEDYQTTDLGDAILSEHEIAIKCSTYVVLPPNYTTIVAEAFQHIMSL